MDKHLKKTSSFGKSKGLTNEIKQAKAFGIVVRRVRQSRKLSQEALATIAGIDRAHMGKIERGEHMPTLGIVFKIAAALEASAGVILIEVEKELK
ncbi:MAG: helix-turn-helix domain-containing protein [Saezia sp.]